jgi:hypothetical protein
MQALQNNPCVRYLTGAEPAKNTYLGRIQPFTVLGSRVGALFGFYIILEHWIRQVEPNVTELRE